MRSTSACLSCSVRMAGGVFSARSPAWVVSFGCAPPTPNRLGQAFGVLLPARKHRNKVVPAMQDHHDEMAHNKQDQATHDGKMPHLRPMKTAHQARQQRKLDGIVKDRP